MARRRALLAQRLLRRAHGRRGQRVTPRRGRCLSTARRRALLAQRLLRGGTCEASALGPVWAGLVARAGRLPRQPRRRAPQPEGGAVWPASSELFSGRSHFRTVFNRVSGHLKQGKVLRVLDLADGVLVVLKSLRRHSGLRQPPAPRRLRGARRAGGEGSRAARWGAPAAAHAPSGPPALRRASVAPPARSLG